MQYHVSTDLTRQALVLDHVVAKELSESAGCADGCRLLPLVVNERTRHAPVLGNQVEKLKVCHVSAVTVEYIQPEVGRVSVRKLEPLMRLYCSACTDDDAPVIGDESDALVALLQSLALKKTLKHRRLKDLDQLQLSASLHLQSPVSEWVSACIC